MKSNKLRHGFLIFANFILVWLFTIILVASFLYSNFVYDTIQQWPLFGLTVVTVIVLIAIFWTLKKLSKHTLKIITIINVVLIVGLTIASYATIRIKPAFDTYYCFEGAREYLQYHCNWHLINPGITHYFFYQCNNLLPLTYIEVFLQHCLSLVGITNFNTTYLVLCSLNIAMFWGAIFLVYRLLKRHFDQYIATGFTFMVFLCWPFYIILDMFYTDWPAMLTSVGILYCYDNLLRTDVEHKQVINIILIVVCATIGSLLKFNVLITLMAIIIHYWMTHKSWKKFLVMVLVLFVPTIVIETGLSKLSLSNPPIAKSELGYPNINWPLMSLNSYDASYDGDWMTHTANLKKHYKNTKKVNQIETKEYFNEISNDPQKLINSISTHVINTYTDGTYGSLLLTTWSPLHHHQDNKSFIGSFVYAKGKNRNVYLYWTTAFNLSLIALMLIGMLTLIIKRHAIDFNYAIILAVLGNMLLLLVWETRSRYLLAFAPLMIYVACWGINELLTWVANHKHKNVKIINNN